MLNLFNTNFDNTHTVYVPINDDVYFHFAFIKEHLLKTISRITITSL